MTSVNSNIISIIFREERISLRNSLNFSLSERVYIATIEVAQKIMQSVTITSCHIFTSYSLHLS